MANENRLINLDFAISKIKDEGLLGSGYSNDERIYDVCDMLKSCPTVDAVEVVHGRWVKHKPKPEAMRAWHRQGIGKAMSENSIFWTCSCCEEWGTPRYNYCPNCGAKMDGDGNG